jgi:hypothetical protein
MRQQILFKTCMGGESMVFRTVQPKEPPLLRLEPFRGMNVSGSPTEINESESPDMLNMSLDERGALNKRTGYERVMNLGTSPIKGMYLYKKSNGPDNFLAASGGKLYTSGIPVKGAGYIIWDTLDLTQTWEVLLA